MTTSLTRHGGLVAMDQWSVMRQQAEVLVKSGFLPATINTPEKAVAVILKGTELGIPAMYSLSNIVVINGKPTCSAELMLALIYRDHGDDALQFERTDGETCVVSYARRGWASRKTYGFSLADAKTAGLLSNQTWQKYPAAMLRARAISAVARLAFPDSIAGMYTPEELEAPVRVDASTGEITVEATEVPGEAGGEHHPVPSLVHGARHAPAPGATPNGTFTRATPEALDRFAGAARALGLSRGDVRTRLRPFGVEEAAELSEADAWTMVAALEETAAHVHAGVD